MALPSYPGPISLSRIQTEFGGTAPIALAGEYYAGGGRTPAGLFGYPLINGVTTKTLIPSGPAGTRISLGNFFGGDVTQFYFIADYMLLTYYFDTGRDLDTRTRMTVPDPGGDYIGWYRFGSGDTSTDLFHQDLPNSSIALQWAGDNTGIGLESVLINVDNIRGYYGNTTITIDLRSQWYDTVGDGNVRINATLYKGGSMVYRTGLYTWNNTTYTDTLALASGNKYGPDIVFSKDSANNGTQVATLTYNTLTGSGTITMS